ncbi:PTS sugar transporter subunit IIA [Streptococcus suis]|nr:PTS sugar transporter subunit IIA [Streptococcus suis]MBY5020548.1 PTS sugar transporter subunit IIA [Streptococcus suis]
MDDNFFLYYDVMEELTKDKALLKIALFLSKEMKADTRCILNSIVERETIANTGLEKGIAVPHVIIKNNAISNAHLAVITFYPPVLDWLCNDETAVDIALCIVLPQSYDLKTKNIEKLTKIFKSLADEEFINSLQLKRNSIDVIRKLENIIN